MESVAVEIHKRDSSHSKTMANHVTVSGPQSNQSSTITRSVCRPVASCEDGLGCRLGIQQPKPLLQSCTPGTDPRGIPGTGTNFAGMHWLIYPLSIHIAIRTPPAVVHSNIITYRIRRFCEITF